MLLPPLSGPAVRASTHGAPCTFPPSRIGAAVLALLMALPPAQAQEAVLNGLGWVRKSAGSELQGSRVQVTGNRADAAVTASGGKVSAGANVAGRVDLVATAQANAAGLQAMDVRDTQIRVVQNQVSGLVNALGGAASANTVLVAGGAGRKQLAGSQLTVSGNTAGSVDAIGAKGAVLLGAASFQLPGRAAANTVLADESDLRRAQVALAGNRADRTLSLGGAALANALTVARSTAQDLQVQLADNTARDVRAGGGSGSLGYGMVASADLTGAAAANSTVIAGSSVQGLRTTHSGNQAENIAATGGSALANSFNLTQYPSGLRQYQADFSGNRARQVLAHGGDGAVLGGALADVSIASTALANSVSVQGGSLGASTRHRVTDNTAEGIRSTGGGAAANSIWLQGANTERAPITVSGNTASRVETAGGAGNIGGGLVGAFERNSRSVASSVVADGGSRIDGAPLVLSRNQARDQRAAGGTAASNSVLVTGAGRLDGVQATLANNQASQLRATGYEGQAGGGLLGAASQQALVLANSLSAEGSAVSSRRFSVSQNVASALTANGGKLLANSVSVEKDGGGGSVLAADVLLSGNTARGVTTGAGGMAGPGQVFSQERRARAAANSVALVDDVQVDAGSSLQISRNTVQGLSAVGGTALVNALGAYRGARIAGSPVTLSDNQARDVRAGGSSGQVAGVGNVRNGILVANGAYLEAQGGARLSQSPVSVAGNTAERLNADGGRVSANALALAGRADVQGGRVVIASNRASDVRSEGAEGTVLGQAVLDRGVGHAAANAALLLGTLRGAAVQIAGNTAAGVAAEKGLAAANSVIADEGSSASQLQATVAGNRAAQTGAQQGHAALASSLQNQGRIEGSGVTVTGNTADAAARRGDALAASMRNSRRGSLSGSQVTIAGNQASAREAGKSATLDNEGTLAGGQITILGNSGHASQDGVVNSVINAGSLRGGQVMVLGNQGQAAGGTVNSLVNKGRIEGSQLTIAGNTGHARQGGTVNSIVNERSGRMQGANVVLAGNNGSARGGGVVNSMVNQGLLTGRVAVVGNTGSANGGGTVNSLVNHGVMSGNVVISGNRGTAAGGGTANSVINRGVISGTVAIVGNQSTVARGMTTGSVRNVGGAIVGSANVTANVPTLANPGWSYTLPSTGVVNRSVTVGPAVSVVNM
jgi:hypothetical protein